jgi:hypothetical protein
VASDNDKLSEVFQQHRERKNQEAAAAEASEMKQARWTGECKKPLQEVVRPVMEDFIAQSRKAGHEAKVNERMDNYVYPGVDFEFTPAADPRSRSHAFPSKITFQCDHPKGVKVSREISSGSGDGVTPVGTCRFGPSRRLPVNGSKPCSLPS